VTETDSTFITAWYLRTTRASPRATFRLGPLTFLVGPNGSGKSKLPRRVALRLGCPQHVPRTCHP